jgi:hypothetical protein
MLLESGVRESGEDISEIHCVSHGVVLLISRTVFISARQFSMEVTIRPMPITISATGLRSLKACCRIRPRRMFEVAGRVSEVRVLWMENVSVPVSCSDICHLLILLESELHVLPVDVCPPAIAFVRPWPSRVAFPQPQPCVCGEMCSVP